MSIVVKNALTFSFHILELPPVDCPPQGCKNEKHQCHRQGDEQVKNVHDMHVQLVGFAGNRLDDSRRALRTTSRELRAIPRPAAQAGSQPYSASGTQARL